MPSIKVQKVRDFVKDPLATFKWFERAVALICISIPIVLRLTDKEPLSPNKWGFRDSISDYAYMLHSYVFGMMLTVAAMLFVYNGIVYLKIEDREELRLSKKGKWYNLVLGLSLLGVVIFPCHDFVWPHYILAGTFFLGNAIVTGIFHKKENRVISIVLAVLTVAFLALAFFDIPGFSLLWGEWFSLTVIAIHFILQSK